MAFAVCGIRLVCASQFRYDTPMLLAAFAILSTLHGHAPEQQPAHSSALLFHVTDPRSSDCGLWTAVEQLARQARLRVGFETLHRCNPGRKALAPAEPSVTLRANSGKEAMAALIQLSPDFAWREFEGIVVIRPRDAWKDSSDPLNKLTDGFSVVNTHPHLAVHEALKSARPSLLIDHVDADTHSFGLPVARGIDVEFEGGTLMQALNKILSDFEGMWQIAFTRNTFHVVLHTFEFEGASTISGQLTRSSR